MSVLVFWVVMPRGLAGDTNNPKNGDSMFLLSNGIYCQVNMALQPRKQTLVKTAVITGAVSAMVFSLWPVHRHKSCLNDCMMCHQMYDKMLAFFFRMVTIRVVQYYIL
jgi:hypothetical protein